MDDLTETAGEKHERRGAGVLSRILPAVGETLLWWVVNTAVWMASLSSFTGARLVVAVICTLPCAMVARPARHANGGNWRFPIGWLSWIPIVLRDIPVQAVKVWLYAVIPGRRHAEVTTLTLPDEDDPTAAGRRASATLSFATTPGTVVCECDPDNGTLLLHRIGQRGRLEKAVQR